jgi:hypothetical protein
MATTNIQMVDHWPPPSTNCDPYKHTTPGQTKFQHHSNLCYNNATTTTLDLGHPDVKLQFCQRFILLLKSPKARATGRQSMDHTCNMIQMIETMKVIFWSFKQNGYVSIAIGAFADMDHIPEFDGIILHYFPNLVEAVPGEFNVTPFVMAHNIPFNELQAHVALNTNTLSKYHPINRTPMTYDIQNDTFYNSQILSRNCMLKPTKEDNDVSLLAMFI